MERRIGACLGCLAFAVAICGGLIAGNSVETTVRRAIFALFAFFALGLFVGWVSERVISERQDQLREELEEKIAAEAKEAAERHRAETEAEVVMDGTPIVGTPSGAAVGPEGGSS